MNTQTETFEHIKNVVNTYVKGTYTLPTFEGKKMVYVVPLSGGCDSLCMAYTMLALFPNEKFIIVHADTGSEVKGTAEALEKFEAFTGQKIERIYPKYDLFTLIEKNGNFLPSQRARFCTQNLKTIPIKVFFNKLRAEHGEDAFFLQFVGLRADEPKRKGIDWNEGFIGSAYPFQSLGLVKSDINNIVSSTQGIPLYYINKSRSGCTSCPFQRRSEIIDSWEESPVALDRAAKMEEIPTTVLNEYNALPTKAHEIAGTSRNWMNYFRPSELGYSTAGFEGRRGKNKMNNKVVDLFGASEAKRLYVAVEYHYYANSFGLCAEAHVFFEKLITYSTSLGGLKIALKHFWLHRISTRELYSMSEEEMTGERQVYIFELEIDDFEKEIPKAPEGVFTWQSDRKPLYAIRKTVAVAERILLTEGERQNLNSSVKMIRESAEDAVPKLNKEKEYGRILNVQKYDKPSLEDLVDDFDIEDAPAPCMSCAR